MHTLERRSSRRTPYRRDDHQSRYERRIQTDSDRLLCDSDRLRRAPAAYVGIAGIVQRLFGIRRPCLLHTDAKHWKPSRMRHDGGQNRFRASNHPGRSRNDQKIPKCRNATSRSIGFANAGIHRIPRRQYSS